MAEVSHHVPSWPTLAWCAATACLFVAALRPVWTWKLRKLPGPWRWPILGHLPGILACGQGGLTDWAYKMRAKYGTVFTVWNGSRPGVIISDPDLCRRILYQSSLRPSLEFFTVLLGEEHQLAHTGMLSLSPDHHGSKFKLMRKAYEAALLSPAALTTHTPAVQECITRLGACLSKHATSGQPVEVTTLLSTMTMNVIGFVAFGIDLHCLDPDQDPSQVQLLDDSWVNKPPTSPEFGRGLTHAARMSFRYTDVSHSTPWKVLNFLFPHFYTPICYLANWLPDKLMREEMKIRSQFTLAIKAIIQAWRQQRAATASGNQLGSMAISDQGFLSRLMETVEREPGLSELDAIAQAYTMVLAGYETTAATLASIMYLLSKNPEAQAQLQREVDTVLQGKMPTLETVEQLPYLKAVVEEGLRIYGPADNVLRELTPSTHDWDLGDGRVIPGGSFIFVNLHAIQTDPSIWPRADEFLPERWLPGNEHLAPKSENAYMPFGGGARKCPGYKFTLLEMHLTLARLVQHFSFSPAEGQPAPVWASGLAWVPSHMWLKVKERETGQ